MSVIAAVANAVGEGAPASVAVGSASFVAVAGGSVGGMNCPGVGGKVRVGASVTDPVEVGDGVAVAVAVPVGLGMDVPVGWGVGTGCRKT